MANDFKIVLQASIDTTQIQKQLEQISKTATVKVSSSGSASPLKPMLDDVQKLGILQTRAYEEDAKRTAKKQADIDKLAKAEEKAANKAIADQEKLNQKFADYQRQVDTFLAKTQKRDLSLPGAQGALDARTDMQEILNGPKTAEALAQLDEANGKIKVADANFQGLNVTTQTFGQQLLGAAKNLGLVYLGMQALQEVMQGIKDGVQYIRDLDKELNNIRLVTGQSKESADALGLTYNKMARDLGVTTLEVTKGALEFQRQGKNIEDTNKLVVDSTKLAALGNMDAADSAEKLTAIMNGYKVAVSDIPPVLDKLVNKIARTYRNIWKISIDKYSYMCYY